MKLKITLLIVLILVAIVALLAVRRQSQENRESVRDSLGYVITTHQSSVFDL